MDERIRVEDGPNGLVVYWVEGSPRDLPPVRSGELADAWREAHDAARRGAWGEHRLFRFATEADTVDILIVDADAACWASAIDRHRNLGTRQGLSMCLRLLASIDLLGRRAEWRDERWRSGRVDPNFLRLAAVAPLTGRGELDELWLQRQRVRPVAIAADPGVPF